MTDVIDRPSGGSGNFRDRLIRIPESGQQVWPSAERRLGPRRRDDALGGPDRRTTPIPVQPIPSSEPREVGPRQRDRHVRGYRHTVLAVDVAAALIGATVAQLVRFGISDESSAGFYWWGLAAVPAMWLLAVVASRAYETRFLASSAEEYQRVINAALGLIAGVAVISYVVKADFARGYVVLALPTCAVVALVGRHFAGMALRRSRSQGKCLQDVLVVGHEWAVLDLAAELHRNPDSGLRVVGACVPGGRGSRQMRDMGVPVVGDLTQVVEAVARVGADVLAVTTCVEFGGAELRRVCWALENSDVEIVVAPALMEVAGPRLHIRPVARLPLLHVEKPEFTGVRRVVKGVFDRVVAGTVLLLLSPILLVVALAVRLTSRGRVIFTQTRVGVKGEPFQIYKFRSMYADAEQRLVDLEAQNERSEGLLFKIRQDPRVTPVGRWLRRFSIDEMPQLFNVLKGDMSLVGPRPPLPVEVENYGDDVRRRLLVRPGVTGLWQVSGRSDLDWDESVRLDLRYVENWSLIYDFAILWKTAAAVLRGSGAY